MNEPDLSLAQLLGPSGPGICRALRAAREFLCGRDVPELLRQVGRTIAEVPAANHLDKRYFQASCRCSPVDRPDDLLTGQGTFYITEQRRLFLDCTAGHYQMTWGYHHPQLTAAVRAAMDAGIVWDDHSNIPGNAVKRLAERLVDAVHGGAADPDLLGDDAGLNTVLLGICTGSVAASSALKLALLHHEQQRPGRAPVLISLQGNYHGTDFLAQRMRGMWPAYFTDITCVEVEPNDVAGLRAAFESHQGHVAAMFAEPVMMNREAIGLDAEFLRTARQLCDAADACLVLDEIQTGFWCPEAFMFRQYGLEPDIVVLGKGMTAGLHPLSAIVYRRKYDRLAQYDAISTNGNAPLAAVAGLGCLELIATQRSRIEQLSRQYFERLWTLAAAHPDRVAGIHGRGLLTGIKFRTVEDALEFHRRAVERGLWVRVHAYHAGHSTILTKFALAADERIADFLVDTFHEILQELGHA